MWRSRAWGVGWLAVAVMAAAACSSRSEGADSTFVVAVEIPTTVAVESSATSVPSTTADPTSAASTTTEAAVDREPLLPDPVDDAAALTHPDAPPPPVDLQADTWAELVGVWSDIDAYWTWLNAHPTDDAGVLSVIFDPEGPEFAEQQDGKAAVAAAGLRLVADDTVGHITGFGCCPNPDEEMATGKIRIVIVSRAPSPHALVLDPAGDVAEELPGWDRAQFSLELRSSVDGDWLIWAFD